MRVFFVQMTREWIRTDAEKMLYLHGDGLAVDRVSFSAKQKCTLKSCLCFYLVLFFNNFFYTFQAFPTNSAGRRMILTLSISKLLVKTNPNFK